MAPAPCPWVMETTVSETEAAHGEEALPRFPLLERLNIPGCREMLDLRRWAHTAPQLTHLRIAHMDSEIATDDLARFLGASECSCNLR